MFRVRISRHFLVLTDVNYLAARMNTLKVALEAVTSVRGDRMLRIAAHSREMASLLTSITIISAAVILATIQNAGANPAIATAYDPLEICIENCALCKRMLGVWFEGPLCADSCLKFKGKLIPECEDYHSISSFLNKP